jgi:hypothetical protein
MKKIFSISILSIMTVFIYSGCFSKSDNSLNGTQDILSTNVNAQTNKTDDDAKIKDESNQQLIPEAEAKGEADNDEKNEITYKDYFTLELPLTWEDKYFLEELEAADNITVIEVVNKANRDAGCGGTLFYIQKYPKEIWEEYKNDAPGTVLGESGDYDFVYTKVSDVQYSLEDDKLKNEYNDMIENIPQILSSIQFK